MLRTAFALCLMMLLLAANAVAGPALDRDTISRWIDAAEEVRAWADEQEDDVLDDDLVDLDADVMPSFADIERAYAEIYRHDPRVRDMIRGHGFTSADQWGNISARITMGMVALEMEDVQPQMDSEMARAMAELENNPDVPPQMREMMRQQMQQAMGGMQRMTEGVREDDIPALREMQGDLRAVIEVGDH